MKAFHTNSPWLDPKYDTGFRREMRLAAEIYVGANSPSTLALLSLNSSDKAFLPLSPSPSVRTPPFSNHKTRLFPDEWIGSIMDSKAKAQFKATTEFLNSLRHLITHTTVAHTPYKTWGCTEVEMEHIVSRAKRDCRHFRNCLNKELFGGNLSRRKPLLYQPLIIATLEGALVNTDRDLTLHYNFSFGNLPRDVDDAQFHSIFRDCWVGRARQRDNIWHDVIGGDEKKAEGWLGYSMKEAESSGNVAVWDFENTQIPYAAFDAD